MKASLLCCLICQISVHFAAASQGLVRGSDLEPRAYLHVHATAVFSRPPICSAAARSLAHHHLISLRLPGSCVIGAREMGVVFLLWVA